MSSSDIWMTYGKHLCPIYIPPTDMGIAQQQCKANVDLVSDNVRALGSRLSIETERGVYYGWVQLAAIVFTKAEFSVAVMMPCALLDYDTQAPPVGLLRRGVVLGSRRYEVMRTQCLSCPAGRRDTRGQGAGTVGA